MHPQALIHNRNINEENELVFDNSAVARSLAQPLIPENTPTRVPETSSQDESNRFKSYIPHCALITISVIGFIILSFIYYLSATLPL